MECEICLEDYNQVEHVPKNMPCGHSVCLQCLQRSDRKECPTCRRVFEVPPDALPNNFALLRLIVRPDRPSRGWCLDCRDFPASSCWDKDHEVLSERKALRRHLQGALQQAPGQLEDLQDQCQGEQVVQALTLLAAESCSLTIKVGNHELTGNVRNTEDPLTQLMWLLVAAKAGLIKSLSPQPAAPGPAPPQERPVREMDVSEVSVTDPDEEQNKKAVLLAKAPGVTRLVNVWCAEDPAWCLQLLVFAAPTLERLIVNAPLEAHLRAVHAMPRLRRLWVWGDATLLAQPPKLPELPALPARHAGLQLLRVENLTRATTQSLLRAYGGTLKELQLGVGTAGRGEWPWGCGDLHSLLQKSGLRALRRVVLRRKVYSHRTTSCSEQRAEVRRVLPGAEVLCNTCDKVEDEEV